MLLDEFLESSLERSSTSVSQQDGTTPHTTKFINEWFADCCTDYILDWRGNSPDISPIGELWAILTQMLRKLNTSTIEKLSTAINSLEILDPDFLKHLGDSVPNHLKEVVKEKGLSSNKEWFVYLPFNIHRINETAVDFIRTFVQMHYGKWSGATLFGAICTM